MGPRICAEVFLRACIHGLLSLPYRQQPKIFLVFPMGPRVCAGFFFFPRMSPCVVISTLNNLNPFGLSMGPLVRAKVFFFVRIPLRVLSIPSTN